MKKLFLGTMAAVLALAVLASVGVGASPPWGGKSANGFQDASQVRASVLPAPSRLGMVVATLTPELAERLGVEVQEGVVVLRVGDDSAADEAGLEKGDIITAANDTAVATPADLMKVIKEAEDSVTLSVVDKSDIVVELSDSHPPRMGDIRGKMKHWLGKKHRGGLWPFRLLQPEMEGIPAGERFSHVMGAEVRVTDKDGVPHTLELIPGTVASVSEDSLTLLTNEGNEVTYTITEDVKGHQLLPRLKEGQKLIVATVDDEVRAIFPPQLLKGHKARPHMEIPVGVEDSEEN